MIIKPDLSQIGFQLQNIGKHVFFTNSGSEAIVAISIVWNASSGCNNVFTLGTNKQLDLISGRTTVANSCLDELVSPGERRRVTPYGWFLVDDEADNERIPECLAEEIIYDLVILENARCIGANNLCLYETLTEMLEEHQRLARSVITLLEGNNMLDNQHLVRVLRSTLDRAINLRLQGRMSYASKVRRFLGRLFVDDILLHIRREGSRATVEWLQAGITSGRRLILSST